MGKVFISGETDDHMKVNTYRIRNMVMVFIPIVTEVNLREIGRMENQMVKVLLLMQKVKVGKESG